MAVPRLDTASGDTTVPRPDVPKSASELSQVSSAIDLRSERERVAKVLHDSVLQCFATCLLQAQLCERFAEMERLDMLIKELPRLQGTLNNSIDIVRNLVTSLREPPTG